MRRGRETRTRRHGRRAPGPQRQRLKGCRSAPSVTRDPRQEEARRGSPLGVPEGPPPCSTLIQDFRPPDRERIGFCDLSRLACGRFFHPNSYS